MLWEFPNTVLDTLSFVLICAYRIWTQCQKYMEVLEVSIPIGQKLEVLEVMNDLCEVSKEDNLY